MSDRDGISPYKIINNIKQTRDENQEKYQSGLLEIFAQ